MRTRLYIERLVIAVVLLLLLALAPAMAQNVVYTGQTTPLAVEQTGFDTYKWELYNDGTVNFATEPGNCPTTMADFDPAGGNAGASVNVKWIEPGRYFFKVTGYDVAGCASNLKVGIIEVKVSVNTPNFPPIAVNDTISSGCAIYGNVVLNDTDLEKDELFVDIIPVVYPSHGTLSLNPDGTFEYRGDPLFTGIDSFVYALFDKTLTPGITATVYISIISDIDYDGIADADDRDADGDGILNEYEGGLTIDTDTDSLPDYLDIDADGDGIVDNYEAQSTKDYVPPVIYDANSDGVNDAYEKVQSGYEIQPIDTDGDGIPDYMDPDSDNDGVPDSIEGHDSNSDGKADQLAKGKDSDGDGLDDGYDTVVNDCNVIANAMGSYASMQDAERDGLPDWRDENDDNDAFPTNFEDLNGDSNYSNDDDDYDGYPEYLDFGRECDLFVPDAFSPNGDNIHDYYQIYCINHFPNARIYIFDSLGNKVFEKANYGNLDVWKSHENAWWNGMPDRGRANTRNEIVAPGTYYYVLDLGNGEVKKSFVFVSY